MFAIAHCLLLAATAQALTFPTLTGRVVDEADVLDAATRQAITEGSGRSLSQSRQFGVTAIPSAELANAP